MTDAAQVGIAWSPPAPGERSELPGHRCKAGQILQLTWGTPVLARSGPSHRTISRKLPPYTLISALTRAREASGGNNRERPARSAGAGGVRLRRRRPSEFSF